MDDPLSPEDGLSSGRSRHEDEGQLTHDDDGIVVYFRVDEDMESFVKKVKDAKFLSSRRDATSLLLRSGIDIVSDLMCHNGKYIKLMKEYKESVDDEYTVTSYGGDSSYLTDKGRKTLSPKIDKGIVSQVDRDIASPLNMEKGHVYRMLLLAGGSEILQGGEIKSRSLERKWMDKWKRVKKKPKEILFDFNKFIETEFGVNREETVERMVEYRGTSKNFIMFYEDEFVGFEGYQDIVDDVGEEKINTLESALVEVCDRIDMGHKL